MDYPQFLGKKCSDFQARDKQNEELKIPVEFPNQALQKVADTPQLSKISSQYPYWLK